MVSTFASAQYDSYEHFKRSQFGKTLGYNKDGSTARDVTQREFNTDFKRALIEVSYSPY